MAVFISITNNNSGNLSDFTSFQMGPENHITFSHSLTAEWETLKTFMITFAWL